MYGDESARSVIHHCEQVMGTVIVLDLYACDDLSTLDLDENLHRALSVLHDADEMFSTWDSKSPMSQFRRGDLTMDRVPSVVGEVLDLCTVARTLTAGWFDPWAMPGGVDPTGYVKGWAT